jgi:hypothetical protein
MGLRERRVMDRAERRIRIMRSMRRLLWSSGAGLAAAATIACTPALGASVAKPAQCATKEPEAPGANAWAPARKDLAPAGASAIRYCRYNSLNTKPALHLAASALVTSPRTVKAMVAEFDALPVMPRGVFCPLDDGAEIDALLAYSGGHSVTVRIELTGCATVGNGSVTRWAGNSTAGHDLLSVIEQLTDYKGSVF